MNVIRKILLLLLVWSSTTWGDTLVLDDGEAFTGQVLRIADGVVVFRPKLAGQMMVRTESVQALETSQNFVISLSDETILYGRLQRRDGVLEVLPIDGTPSVPIRFEAIVQALAIPTAPQNDEPGMSEWRTTVESGILSRFGGNKALADAVLRLESEGIGSRIALRGELTTGLSPDEGALRYLDGRLVVQEAGSGLAPYGAATLQRDAEFGLEWRTDLSLGLRRAWERDQDGLALFFGLGYEWAQWQAEEVFRRSSRENTEGLNLQLGLRYEVLFRERTQFIGQLFLLPEVGDWGEFRADSSAELRYPLSDRLHLRLELRLDYNSQEPIRDMTPLKGGFGAGFGLTF